MAENGLTEQLGKDYKLLIDVKDLASILGAAPRTLWRWRSAGKLIEPIQIGGSTRWRTEEVRDWIAAGCPSAEAWQNESNRGGTDQWRPSAN